MKEVKNVDELKALISESPVAFPDGTIVPTTDGDFIVVSNKPIRLDRSFKMIDPLKVFLPKIDYDVLADRAVLVKVDRQTQFTKEGMMSPEMVKIYVQNAQGRNIEQSYRKSRFFIVKCSKGFSNGATAGEVVLERGDEVILAHHLDGLPSFPTIEDPTGIVVNECISLHYTEIVGYKKWHRNEQ